MFIARIGINGDVFGLGTPLDHPPETTQWVTAWVGEYYILYINRIKTGGLGGVVEWGHETKNNHLLPRSSRQQKQQFEREKIIKSNYHDKSIYTF